MCYIRQDCATVYVYYRMPIPAHICIIPAYVFQYHECTLGRNKSNSGATIPTRARAWLAVSSELAIRSREARRYRGSSSSRVRGSEAREGRDWLLGRPHIFTSRSLAARAIRTLPLGALHEKRGRGGKGPNHLGHDGESAVEPRRGYGACPASARPQSHAATAKSLMLTLSDGRALDHGTWNSRDVICVSITPYILRVGPNI
jgi:hypothetical protein